VHYKCITATFLKWHDVCTYVCTYVVISTIHWMHLLKRSSMMGSGDFKEGLLSKELKCLLMGYVPNPTDVSDNCVVRHDGLCK
jgi:hypothetical protein